MTYTNLVGDKEEPSVKFIWTPLRAWKQRPGGTVMESREDVRAYFEGQTAASPWDRMQLLYFVSQALWRHTCAPFYLTWPGFEIREAGVEPVEHDQRPSPASTLLPVFTATFIHSLIAKKAAASQLGEDLAVKHVSMHIIHSPRMLEEGSRKTHFLAFPGAIRSPSCVQGSETGSKPTGP